MRDSLQSGLGAGIECYCLRFSASFRFRHSLATTLVKLKVDPKTVQGILRHEDFGTTMDLYAQSDMESMRDAQGKFLEQLMGNKIHLLTERVQ